MFASFDVQTEDRAELVDLMREWTRAAERMSVGRPVGRDNDDLVAPPDDTGEAVGLTPANLTVTFGFGASLFALRRRTPLRPRRRTTGRARRSSRLQQ